MTVAELAQQILTKVLAFERHHLENRAIGLPTNNRALDAHFDDIKALCLAQMNVHTFVDCSPLDVLRHFGYDVIERDNELLVIPPKKVEGA